MVLWLWIGGAVMAIGTILAAFPGRRAGATEPVSAPVADRAESINPSLRDRDVPV